MNKQEQMKKHLTRSQKDLAAPSWRSLNQTFLIFLNNFKYHNKTQIKYQDWPIKWKTFSKIDFITYFYRKVY